MVTVVIGRDHQTNQLRLSANGNTQSFPNEKLLPSSVGEKHVAFIVNDDGTMILKNLSIQNDTYVNMVGIESKRIKEGDRIELGNDHYILSWDILKPFIPKFADIRSLKIVRENYENEKKRIREKQKNVGLLTSVPIACTMLGGLLSAQKPGPITYSFAAIAFIIMLVGLFLRKVDKSPEKLEEIEKQYQHDYVCPNCGHFLGNLPYDIICQDTRCRYCQAIYKK